MKSTRRHRTHANSRALKLESLEDRRMLATFVVNDSGDAGEGTLRQAILDANSTPGSDSIQFQLNADDLKIAPRSALPIITDTLLLDATTQSGFVDRPIVELSGENLSAGEHGLDLWASDSLIAGFVVHSFPGNGIGVYRASNNLIQQNYVGVSVDGQVAMPNGQSGIAVVEADHNLIGGPELGNLLSGNGWEGLRLWDSDHNSVQGNFIGTDATGQSAVPNELSGLYVASSSFTNLIGTDADGESDAAESNLISGNGGDGIKISSSRGFRIGGNRIGTDSSGQSALANAYSGIFVEDSDVGTIGVLSSDGVIGNLVSGNGAQGIRLNRSANTNIVGNVVGLSEDGLSELGNEGSGILIDEMSSEVRIGGVLVKQDDPYRNVISGNGFHGVWIFNSDGISVTANDIGVAADGRTGFGNAGNGVMINAGSTRISVGLADHRGSNVISGNALNGVRVVASQDTEIVGNRIGTDREGVEAIPNGVNGIRTDPAAEQVLIGGDTASAGNHISGNTRDGILMVGTSSAVVQGNVVGLSENDESLGNGRHGIFLAGGTTDVVVGTSDETRVGIDIATRNVISGNAGSGVLIAHENTKRNRISGNFIGLDSLGSAAVANGASGVRIGGGASENIVGTVESSLADSVWKNRIAGNEEYGVHIINSSGNSVAGNDIGFRIDANADLPNKLGGIYLDGASDNQLGGNGPGQGNRIAGNGAYGIALVDDSNGNVVTGNSIGLSRQMRLDNQFGAVSIVNSSGNQIGVKGEAKNRIVSNAVDVGVHVTGTDSDANTIINNDFEGISLPIDLGADGPTLNDDGDVDVGPNGLQNFPVVQQAGSDSEGSEVAGRLDAEPNATFEIEVFYQNASGGQTVVGYTEVATDSSGYGFWVLETDDGIPAGARVSATAHKSGVTTSEWSLPTETVGRLDVQSASSEVNEGGGPVQFTIVRPTGLSGRIAVGLEASHPSQVGLPDEVVLPEGQDSVHFDVQIIDDESVELPIDVTILARAGLGAAQFVGMAQVQVIDDDLAWHNVMKPLDVNGDLFIVPTDVLLIVNYINGENPADVTGIEPPRPNYYLDTNGDGFVTPSDVLLVINHLNSGSGEGERDSSGEMVDSALGAIDWIAIEQELKKKLTSAAT